MINAGTLFIQIRETTERTWFYFEDTLKQEQTLLYQGDTLELDSIQYIFDKDTKQNIFTIVTFPNSTAAKMVKAGNNRYLTKKLDKRGNIVFHVKKQDRTGIRFQLFETNLRNLCYTNESLRIKERNFSPTDISETDLKDTKLDQFIVWDFRAMFKKLKEIELLNF